VTSTPIAAAGRGGRPAAATVLAALVAAETGTTIVAGAASGLGWDRLVDLFVVTNTVIGAALAAAGWPLARHRPDNRVGWWLLAGGLLYGATATGVTVLACVAGQGWPGRPAWRVLATLTNGSWAVALALCLPMALLSFPDGRLPGRHWRWVAGGVAAGSLLFTASAVLDPLGGLNGEVGVPGYPAWPGAARFGAVAAAGNVLLVCSYLAIPVALAVRYRRGSETVRRQVLWPVLAVLVMVTCFVLESWLGLSFLLLGVLPITLVPAAITIAVLRHQLLDIRLAVSRSVLYLLLTAAVVAVYVGLVSLLGRALPVSSSIVAALVVAMAFNPARIWLQRRVDRALYGARRDPVRAIAEVGAHLSAEDGLDGIPEAVCRVLRLPAAAIVVGGAPVAAYGDMPPARHGVPLAEDGGELVVGLRSGESRLNPADARILELLAAVVTVAVRAGRLADELAVSRERVISGREEERRRIRRDLHDGLGPQLTGVLLNADAAWHLFETEPERSAGLIASVRDQTIAAIEDIRRLVYDLRPPALDGLGLVGALREYALTVGGGTLKVTVHTTGPIEELPAAVEVAAYRIATEAIANTARHSAAATAVVELRREPDALCVSVCDDGVNEDGAWRPGLGLTSMRERAVELGGTCRIEHDRDGARVHVRLPVSGHEQGSAAMTTAARP
jgi:two-component system NarL family sensor kinase